MNIFTQFIKSLYSPKDMASFRFQGIGKTILFVFFLVLITSIPLFVNLGTDVFKFVSSTQTIFKADTPDFYLEDGQFHAETDEPFILKDQDTTIIFDPENELSIDEIRAYPEVLAIQKNEAIFQYGNTLEYIPFNDLQGVYFDKADFVSLIESVESSLPIIVTLLILAGYIFFSAIKFIQITILGLLGLVLKNSLKRHNLRFRHTWILSAYALTIPSVFFAIMDLLRVQIPGAILLNFAVTIFVLFLVMKEIKVKQQKPIE
ncbi:DUF1189 domain-containing protein [Sutcliffiella halmapala]|uniref:DUF1189 domain-containing protein n=1 Tax=Sutcliffiella halmapala TaxID=79882 RepID=UPI000994D4CC|nr:DUF1189 domain-containing protein [Sutcliffiella halmapala]